MQEYLDQILSKIRTLSHSIILVGSNVTGSTSSESDIDLIIIVKDEESAKSVKKITRVVQNSNDRHSLDCKIYTEQEFVKAKTGRDHFFLWSAFKNSRTLHGCDSWTNIKLIPSKVTSILWNCIREIENATVLIEMRAQFTGVCFKLYSSLKTVYFGEVCFMKMNDSRKSAFIQEILGDQYRICLNRYKWVAGQLEDHSTEKLKVPSNIDRRYRDSDYKKLEGICKSASEFVSRRVPELIKVIEEI